MKITFNNVKLPLSAFGNPIEVTIDGAKFVVTNMMVEHGGVSPVTELYLTPMHEIFNARLFPPLTTFDVYIKQKKNLKPSAVSRPKKD